MIKTKLLGVSSLVLLSICLTPNVDVTVAKTRIENEVRESIEKAVDVDSISVVVKDTKGSLRGSVEGGFKTVRLKANSKVVTKKKEKKLNLNFKSSEIIKYSDGKHKIWSMPTKKSESIGSISDNSKIKVTGVAGKWSRVYFNGADAFIKTSDLMSCKRVKKSKSSDSYKSDSYKWDGSKLTRSGGVNYGPSGKETYYNLDMSGVVRIMRDMGNNDKYWVRDDGCKMLGDYIMVAANLSVRPRGSLVPTSLGMGIVCDTGTFAETNPYQLDIAVTW